MRRLPVFFLVDVSESMAGENLYQLEEGIGSILSTLRQDPYALETAFLSVIAFAGKVKTLTPLTELFAFYPPELPCGGGTALGKALDYLMDEIDRSVHVTTHEQKGDWSPIVFLLTDGHSTDNVSSSIKRWNISYRNRANIVAVSIGGGADHTILKKLTENVLVFNDTAPDAFSRFVKWVSLSIQSQSRSVSTEQSNQVSLAKADSELLASVDSNRESFLYEGLDDRYAVFIGKCAKKNLPYLIKYQRHLGRIETSDPVLSKLLQTRRYALDVTVPIKNNYFDFSDDQESDLSVSSEDLIGQPNCPHCGAQFAMAVCRCGKILCVEDGGERTCPWCGDTSTYGASEDGEGFDIGRGRG